MPVAAEAGPIGITVSIGLAAAGPGETLQDAMRRASRVSPLTGRSPP
jgi:hypothetical protein